MKGAFISDCEGPISKNDNAYEVSAHFVPNGCRLYPIISRYDDVLSDVLKRSGYKAGYTLKLILPFLIAYSVKDRKIHEFSVKNLVLVPNIKDTLQHVRSIASVFIVSTSYKHYINALCQALDFPFENTYCTRVSIDKYHITEQEKNRLKELAKEIAKMALIQIPPNAESISDFSKGDQNSIRRLDEIFWKELAGMKSGRVYSEVSPMGAGEKAEAVQDIVRKLGVRFSNVMYVGDSITDEEAFNLVRENDGLTISFNGNRYAVRSAEIAVLSENSIPTAIIADVFCRFGKQQAIRMAENWNAEALKKSHVNPSLLERFFRLYPSKSSKVRIVTDESIETLAEESSEFRRKVRGEAVGRLG